MSEIVEYFGINLMYSDKINERKISSMLNLIQ